MIDPNAEKEIRKLIELAGLKNHTGIRAVSQMALATQNTTLLQRVIRFLTSLAAAKNIEPHPFLPGPLLEELPPGDIPIGNLDSISSNEPLLIPLDYFTEHVMVTGTTGMGKSWVVKFMTLWLIERGANVWYFDTEQEYDDLALYLPPDKLWIFDVTKGNFKRNFLQPLPSESTSDVMSRNKDIWREMFLRDGSINLFGELLNDLYLNHADGWPTLSDFYERLPKLRYRLDSRRGQYMESLLNRATNLVQFMSHTYDVIEGYDLGELMSHSIVFRLAGLSADIQEFFVNELLASVADYRLKSNDVGLLIIVLDEAHRFFSLSKRIRMDLMEPIIYDLVRTFRKRNVGVIVSTQVPSELPASASANLGLRIVLRTIDGNCIRAIGDSMALNKEQREFLSELPERKAIVHYKGYPTAFLIEIPQLEFSQKISEAEIKERMAPVLASLRFVPARREGTASKSPGAGGAISRKRRTNTAEPAPPGFKHGFAVPGLVGFESNRSVSGTGDEPVSSMSWDEPRRFSGTESERTFLSKDKIDYLFEIANSPFEPQSRRDARLHLSGYKGDRLRSELQAEGLIRVHKLNTGKRGGLIVLLEPTEKAYEYLESIKANIKKPKGKGGFIHAFWQHHVAELFKGKAEVWIEDSRAGKLVDIGIRVNGKNVAIEIAMKSEEKELRNISKDLEFYDEVILLVEETKTYVNLRRKLDSIGNEVLDSVRVELLRSFINGENFRLSHILQPSPEASAELRLRAREGLSIRGKEQKGIKEEKKEKEIRPETETRNKWSERIWYCLKHLDDLTALNQSPLIRLKYIETLSKQKYKNEGLPKARALREVIELCTGRLIAGFEKETNSSKIAQYLRLAKKGLNNSQIARELGLTREHVSRFYRNKVIELVTQEFLSAVGHSNLASF